MAVLLVFAFPSVDRVRLFEFAMVLFWAELFVFIATVGCTIRRTSKAIARIDEGDTILAIIRRTSADSDFDSSKLGAFVLHLANEAAVDTMNRNATKFVLKRCLSDTGEVETKNDDSSDEESPPPPPPLPIESP